MNLLIIGATSGIGRATAHIFAKNKHHVICSSRDNEELMSLKNDLEIRYNTKTSAIPFDLTDLDAIKIYIENLYKITNRIDCLIITAGDMPEDSTDYSDQKALIHTITVNYTGIASVINKISCRMIGDHHPAKIICLSSVAGERGRQSNFIYGASKAALTAYLQGLRMKLHKKNIQVITVLPGYVDTLMSYGKVNKRFAVSPDYVAKRIYRLAFNPRDVVYIPGIWRIIMAVIRMIPEKFFKKLSF